MNDLDKLIGNLNPDIWINSEYINGFGVNNPSDNVSISGVTNLGSAGSAANAIIGNLSAPIFKSISNGLNNRPYIDIDMTLGLSGKGLYIKDNTFPTTNNKFSLMVIASDITVIDGNNYGIGSRDAGTNLGTFSIGITSTSTDYSVINGQIHLGNFESNFTGSIRYINADRHTRSFLANIRTFDGDVNSKIIAADYTYYIEGINVANGASMSRQNYPITFGFRGRTQLSDANTVELSVNASKNKHRLYEFCYWNRALTTTEVYKIQSYIKQKYNI